MNFKKANYVKKLISKLRNLLRTEFLKGKICWKIEFQKGEFLLKNIVFQKDGKFSCWKVLWKSLKVENLLQQIFRTQFLQWCLEQWLYWNWPDPRLLCSSWTTFQVLLPLLQSKYLQPFLSSNWKEALLSVKKNHIFNISELFYLLYWISK